MALRLDRQATPAAADGYRQLLDRTDAAVLLLFRIFIDG
jgi:hypothetical protein